MVDSTVSACGAFDVRGRPELPFVPIPGTWPLNTMQGHFREFQDGVVPPNCRPRAGVLLVNYEWPDKVDAVLRRGEGKALGNRAVLLESVFSSFGRPDVRGLCNPWMA